jgi:glutathione synthase
MDDPRSFDPKKDTTYLLIHECQRKGHDTFYIHDIGIHNNELIISAHKINAFQIGGGIDFNPSIQKLTPEMVSVIWIRKDPPVNASYVRALLIFQQFSDRIKCINHPLGVLRTNEKLAATTYTNLTPATLISQNKDDLLTFIQTHGDCVLKPLNGYGGRGIFKVSMNDTNLLPMLELSTHDFTTQIVCQKTVRHQNGDKRIILLNQKAIGAINRVNHTGHRNNFMSGGHAEKAHVTTEDQGIIDTIAPMLKENGLFFVGIDIIDHHLIEINVTSPTGIQEINQWHHSALQKEIIAAMETIVLEASC